MTLMDPKAAAEAIRAAYEKDPPHPEADDRHRMTFLEEVCEHLGVEPNPHTVSHVAHLLTHHDVQMHKPDEYPKMMTEKDSLGRVVAKLDEQGNYIIFNSSEEEEAWLAGQHQDDAPAHEERRFFEDGEEH